jgi:sugar lactone lactonase YvrE
VAPAARAFPRLGGLAALGLLAACDPCPPARSIDDALQRACTLGDAGAPDAAPSVTCTPRGGTICTVVGTGEAGLGEERVAGQATKLYLPQDVTMGPDGNAYFVDWNNHRIRVLTTNNVVFTVAGSGELSDADATPESMPSRTPEPALTTRLNHPTNIAFDAQGRMLIAAWHNSSVKRVTLHTDPTMNMIEVICGTGARGFGGDGAGAFDAVLDLPVGVAIHPTTSELYIADQANQRVRRVDGMDVINTVVGTGTRGFAGDGGPALMAQINNTVGQAATPSGRIAFDAQGDLFIADTGNHRVRRVDAQGVITTVAGTGNAGTMGDNGPAVMAELNGPTDVDVGPDGTLYIADTGNSCIRAVGADGVIHTVAGQCGHSGSSGDGGAPTDALLNRPYGIETDTQGNLWISDTYNQRIRLVCTGQGRSLLRRALNLRAAQ